jgi:hypothetical protein
MRPKGIAMASKEFASIRHLYATTRQNDAKLTLAEQRAEAEHFSDLAVEPQGLDYRHDQFGGVRVLVITPDGADPGCVIEYLHGGAMPESDAAVERIGTFIRRHLSVQCAR